MAEKLLPNFSITAVTIHNMFTERPEWCALVAWWAHDVDVVENSRKLDASISNVYGPGTRSGSVCVCSAALYLCVGCCDGVECCWVGLGFQGCVRCGCIVESLKLTKFARCAIDQCFVLSVTFCYFENILKVTNNEFQWNSKQNSFLKKGNSCDIHPPP